MSDPIETSEATDAASAGERWNALIELISGADLDELTPVQRVAHLVWWYSNQVLNGGHDQYFGNKDYFDHSEVINALTLFGAGCQREVLRRALAYYTSAQNVMPDEYDKYIGWESEYGYSDQMAEFDRESYDCSPEIETELLEKYLDANGSEFIKRVT